MNVRTLKKLLSAGETESIEFKESANEHFYKTLSAFANTRGGLLFLGVDDKGGITGVESSSTFLEDLTNRIVNKLSLYPQIETMHVQQKRILCVHVVRTSFAVSYEGKYYERVGSTTRQMEPHKLRALLLSGKSWDGLTGSFSWKEINEETIDRFVKLATETNRLTGLSKNESPRVVFKKLGLMEDGKLTNAAMLLFGKNPQEHFINLCVRLGRFKTETDILDDKWIKGNLFQQFEETLTILKQHISVRYEIKDIQRKDIWDYPIPALREAVLNALIHRDYFNIANFILIKVYDDHIWFTNPGQLPEGITLEQLKKPHPSRVRNPLIAKVFYLAGFIEQYGSGTVRMVEWMKEAGLPEPEYGEDEGSFSVYFYRDMVREESLRKMGLSERQIKAVMAVKEKGMITNKDYRQMSGLSRQMATIDLSRLEEKGILKRVGKAGRGIAYQLTKMTNKQPIIDQRQRGEMGGEGALKGRGNYTKDREKWLGKVTMQDVLSDVKRLRKKK